MMKRRPTTLSRTGEPAPARSGKPVPVFAFLTLAAVALLGGCDTVGNFFHPPEPPLPGDRISVLLHQRTLSPDPKLANVQILLPAPEPNADWPQAGGYANHAMHHMLAPETIREAWSVDIGDGVDGEERLAASPIIADGRVFAIDALSVVSAYDISNGNRLWRRDPTPGADDEGHIPG
ncbi:MAG: hypothetical protein H8E39_07540, partial [Alphaproteobacteria bacterium]|nr:hypothetical protein [Alphaproteobacteria bacterium]